MTIAGHPPDATMKESCCIVGQSKTLLFSGTANPTLLDTTVPGDGTPLDVTFKGPQNHRGPVDLTWTDEGTSPALPWSIRISFGATDNSAAVLGWDDGWEKYGEDDDMQAVTLANGGRAAVGIAQSAISFTKK